MKKVFIDLGAHFGEITKHFAKHHKGYEIYLFEPNPNIKIDLPYNIYRVAAWIKDEERDFYLLDDKTSEGCTLVREKINVTQENKRDAIRVKCIDFSRWLKRTFDDTDYIVIKMDIEGAEYEVLHAMIGLGIIGMVNKLYVEWHAKKIKYPKVRQDELKEKLRQIEGLELKKEYCRVEKV